MSPITPIATYLLYLTLSIPNSHFCTHKDRITPVTTENQPVCALYSGECSSVSGFCQKTYSNAQAACNDENVLVYTTGECNQASVQACPASESDSQEVVCSFSVQRRLGGVSEDAIKSSVSAHEACKSDSTAFFVKSDCSAAGNAGICTKDKRAEAGKCTPSTEAISCVYYAGGDCQAELCRKTQKTDCSLCQDMSVLFFTEGACEGSDAKTVELERSLYVIQQDVPTGLDLHHDDSGVEETETAPEDDPNGLDLSNDDANVEPEVAPQDDPNGWDLSNDDAGVEPEVNNDDQNNGWDLSNDVPEVETKTLADGTIELTPVVPHDDSGVEETENAPEDDPNGLDLSNDVPEVEAKTLADGTIEMTPVAPQDDPNGLDLSNDDADIEPEVAPEDGDDPNGWDLSNDEPQVEAETLADGTIMLNPVASQDDPNGLDLTIDDAGVEPEVNNDDQDNGYDLSNDVPEVEAKTLEDGTIELTPVVPHDDSGVEETETAPEDDPNGWDLSNDDAGAEPEVEAISEKLLPDSVVEANAKANAESNGLDLSNDDAGTEPEVEAISEKLLPDSVVEANKNANDNTKPKASSPYNTHNFKFNAIPLENTNDAFKAELSNGMTVASFQEPSEEN